MSDSVAEAPRTSPAGTSVSDTTRRVLALVADAGLTRGDKLPAERQLAAELGVSRSVVREALAALDLLGVVDVRHGSGTYLAGRPSTLLPQAIEAGLVVGRPETFQLVEARHHLEVALASIAARRIEPEGLVRLSEALAQMQRTGSAGDIDAFVDADVAFHLVVAEVSGNVVLADMLGSVRSLLGVWMSRAVRADGGHVHDTLAEHGAVLDAIAAGRPTAAERAMRVHMRNAESRLMRTLRDVPEE
ncbi:FadR/GntR family transcriptional regulator [Kineococcus sp. SYSU DK003]|uniref:FadR/GntR family transcriptional regulator n=1 Tax=Kineococcus sp. SYSU DK003 TaxID=3383124 RepID=UPI003D7DC6F6